MPRLPGISSDRSEKLSRRRDLHESVAVIPSGYYMGNPRVQFHLNRRFLRRKLLSGGAGEFGLLPGWKIAWATPEAALAQCLSRACIRG